MARSQATSTRHSYSVINYATAVFNVLLFVLGAGSAGYAGSTLKWANDANLSSTVYHIKPELISTQYPLYSDLIRVAPRDWHLTGQQLVLAADVSAAFFAGFTLLYIFGDSLRALRRTAPYPTENYTSAAVLMLSIFGASILTLVTVIIGAQEEFQSPHLYLINGYISDTTHTYTGSNLNVESWLAQLARSIVEVDAQTTLSRQHVLARTGRFITIPILALQMCTITTLMMIRQRMKPGKGPIGQSTPAEIVVIAAPVDDSHQHSGGKDVNVDVDVEMQYKTGSMHETNQEWDEHVIVDDDDECMVEQPK